MHATSVDDRNGSRRCSAGGPRAHQSTAKQEALLRDGTWHVPDDDIWPVLLPDREAIAEQYYQEYCDQRAKENPSVAGYCYLALVREDEWTLAAGELGHNPTFAEVICWAEDNVGRWSHGKFAVTYGLHPCCDSGGYVQAHVSVSATGLSHREVFRLPSGGCRLGADPQAPTADAMGATAGSQRTVNAPRTTSVVRVPFYATLTTESNACAFSPRTSVGVQGLTKFFESAELVSLGVSLTIAGGDTVLVAVGCGVGARTPEDVSTFLALPTAATFTGSSQGHGVGEFELPPDHGFGREVKAIAVGNPDPVLHVLLEAEVPATVRLRGHVTLRLLGTGVPSPIQLGVRAHAGSR